MLASGNKENYESSPNSPKRLKQDEQFDIPTEAQEQGANTSENVDIAVSLGCPSMVDGIESTPVLLSLRPPQGKGRVPTDIICVIDASYSMSDEAKVQNEKGVSEATGLTILDVTKHAVRTVFNVLQPSDRLSIVSFADTGQIDLELTAMDADGRASAEKCIAALIERGGTNLWAGVEKGLEVAAAANPASCESWSAADCNRLTHILLLTDGVPTTNPPKGKGTECEHLREYKEQLGGQLPCTLTTFGFGYNLMSEMLTELAELGSGSYAFIPDSGLVGTVFVNAISNLLATMALSAELCLEPLSGAEFAPEPCVLGGHPAILTPERKLQVNIGTLRFGQSKDIVVRMRFGASKANALPTKRMPFGRYKDKKDDGDASPMGVAENAKDNRPYLSATLSYRARNPEGAPKVSTASMSTAMRAVSPEVEVHCHRLNAAFSISQALKLALEGGTQLEQAQRVISDIALAIRGSASAEDERIKALLEDLDGQVSESLSRSDFLNKWGKHYLPSLRLAHLHQQCNNFKDPGVQHYAGDFFGEIRDAADEIFLQLPPPEPTMKNQRAAVSAPQNMSMFYNCGGGCFDGECSVSMADGSQKALNLVSQGDYVRTPTGSAKVTCVVKTLCNGGKTQLVELPEGLLATPYHPVRVAGTWSFPCDLVTATLRTCPAVYNLVLQGNHPSMLISGVECSVLGHGLQEPVVAHEFFGTHRIIESLQRMPGWELGLVELVPGNYKRDPATGRVCGLQAEVVEHQPIAFPCKVELQNGGLEVPEEVLIFA